MGKKGSSNERRMREGEKSAREGENGARKIEERERKNLIGIIRGRGEK